jgi:hypothetical protein
MNDVFTRERLIWIRRQQRRQRLIERALDVLVIAGIVAVYAWMVKP